MGTSLSAVLHEVIDAVQHVLTPNRVGELHKAVDDLGGVEADVNAVTSALDKLAPEAPAPAAPAPAAPAAPAAAPADGTPSA